LKDEHQNKKEKPLDLSGWLDYTPTDIPHQKNGYDCGVFMCKFADYAAKNQKFSFSQNNMEFFRKLMALEIINKKAK
jgi:sentrin-specific protease 1